MAAAVRSEIVLQPPPPVFLNTNSNRLDKEQGGAALYGEDYCGVAVARLWGTALPHRSLPAFIRQQIVAKFAGYGSYDRIGATYTDPVQRGGIEQGSSGKHSGTERRRRCHARESPLPLAEGGIKAA